LNGSRLDGLGPKDNMKKVVKKALIVFAMVISLMAGMMMGAFLTEIADHMGVWDALDERAYTVDE
jgi:hypothetical protein